jgi:hypothetical protein
VTLALRPFLIYCSSPYFFYSFLIWPPAVSGNYQQRYPVAKEEKLDKEMAVEFCVRTSLSLSYS